MSANGAKPGGTPYQWSKYLAEEYVKSKVFDWTIFRPSILFGNPDYPRSVEDKPSFAKATEGKPAFAEASEGKPAFASSDAKALEGKKATPVFRSRSTAEDGEGKPSFAKATESKPEFCTTLLKQMIESPIPAPMFHPGLNLRQAGKFKLQPVHVSVVAQGIVKSLTNRRSIGKVYHIGGPDEFTWREIVDIIAATAGKKKWKIPIPAWGAKLFAFLFGWLPSFPITKDQITMLMEGNTCNSNEFYRDFGIEPIPFSIENIGYIRKRME
jgi:uncharacterized protein YbjT (DUF2867 family)